MGKDLIKHFQMITLIISRKLYIININIKNRIIRNSASIKIIIDYKNSTWANTLSKKQLKLEIYKKMYKKNSVCEAGILFGGKSLNIYSSAFIFNSFTVSDR